MIKSFEVRLTTESKRLRFWRKLKRSLFIILRIIIENFSSWNSSTVWILILLKLILLITKRLIKLFCAVQSMKIIIFFASTSTLINKRARRADNVNSISFCFDLLTLTYWLISTVFKKIVELLNSYCDFRILMILSTLKRFKKSITDFICSLYQI